MMPVMVAVVVTRPVEVMVTMQVATVPVVTAHMTRVAILGLLDHVAGRRGLGGHGERRCFDRAGGCDEAEAGDSDRQCGCLDQGLSYACHHF